MAARDVILHNFRLKLLSLGLASLIWVGVRYQIQSEYPFTTQALATHPVFKQTLKVRVSTITPGDGRGFRIVPRDVQVTVLGEESVLRKLSPTNLIVYIDLTDFNSRTPVPMELHAHTPPEVIVGDIQPSEVTVEQIIARPQILPPERTPEKR
jgi:hypothetical protein